MSQAACLCMRLRRIARTHFARASIPRPPRRSLRSSAAKIPPRKAIDGSRCCSGSGSSSRWIVSVEFRSKTLQKASERCLRPTSSLIPLKRPQERAWKGGSAPFAIALQHHVRLIPVKMTQEGGWDSLPVHFRSKTPQERSWFPLTQKFSLSFPSVPSGALER